MSAFFEWEIALRKQPSQCRVPRWTVDEPTALHGVSVVNNKFVALSLSLSLAPALHDCKDA